MRLTSEGAMFGGAWMWTIIATHLVIALASGEISIRYLGWYAKIRREGAKLVELVYGIGFLTGILFLIQLNYLWVQLQPKNLQHLPLSYGMVSFEVLRLGVIVCLSILTIPVIKLHYRQDWNTARRELWQRAGLIVVCVMIGAGGTLGVLRYS